MATQKYVLGRGKVYFSRFTDTTNLVPSGYRYIGNTPEFSMTVEAETLDHYSSDGGIRQKDDSVAVDVTRTGQVTCDNIVVDNVALFFFGASSTVSQAAVSTDTNETIADVIQGCDYLVGRTAANPVGIRGLKAAAIVVKVSTTTKTLGSDYTVNVATGMIHIVAGGGISTGDDIIVTYQVDANTQTAVVSGSTMIEGSILFIADNPKGDNLDYVLPWVKVSPNGDFNLKGEDWQQIPFKLEILKPPSSEAILMRGRPA